MTLPSPTIVWFRRDLRLRDNPALAAAAAVGAVLPVYILDSGPRRPGAASFWWLDKSLRALAADLSSMGARLILRRGDPMRALMTLAHETGARGVHWNRLYDQSSVERDAKIKTALRADGRIAESFNGALLNEPWSVKTASGGPFKVFTPYWKAARPLCEDAAPGQDVRRLEAYAGDVRSDNLDDWRLHPRSPDWSGGFTDWRPGEAGARRRLSAFLDDEIQRYAADRNRPDLTGTSRLSPHLHFGEVSPRQVWEAARGHETSNASARASIDSFLRELGWREFNYHLLFHFPEMEQDGFNTRFAEIPWLNDEVMIEAWRRGRTGYPIVDAGMRQLWRTGWMHNRVRMITASFLTKDLMADWRIGESWFWDTLVDADLANNVCGWQWVAGCGADAAPYFRVFNPVLQALKFDPGGNYVRTWAPELAKLPNACIHEPWRADAAVLADAGVRLGVDYPTPVLDHAIARERALAAFKRLP